MKNGFFEYLQPSEVEFEQLWQNCVFSFDASVLLDLYRYSSESRKELLQAMQANRERIWITHQAAFEFNKHRLKIMADAHSRADRLASRLEDVVKAIATDYQQHPYVDATICEPIVENLK